MNKKITLLFLLFSSQCICQIQSIVTYNAQELGRIGDRLMIYTKALWIGDHYHMPFAYAPFDISTEHATNFQAELKLNIKDSHQVDIPANLPRVIVQIPKHLNPDVPKIYQIHYKYKEDSWADSLEVATWKGLIDNEPFLEKLRSYVSLKFEYKKLDLPNDRITIALHTRKGSGTELPLYIKQSRQIYADKTWPTKFIPDSFFIKQLKYISERYNNKPIYVHIFTDFHSPQQIVNKYRNAVNKPNITYGCRVVGNDHCTHTLEDLFDMTRFDCLLRGGSNYAQIAHLLGTHKLVIYPKTAIWQGNQMIVTPGIIAKDA